KGEERREERRQEVTTQQAGAWRFTQRRPAVLSPPSEHLPIKTPVLNSFRHMLGRDRVSLLKVRDRARNLENPHVGSRREPEPRPRLFDQRPPRSVDPAVLP